MNQIVRRNTFETNSSSAHSLILISKDTFNRWKNKELYLQKYIWSDDIEDKDFKSNSNGISYEEYEEEVVQSAYDDHSFWDEEGKYLELSKEGLSVVDFDNWDKNPYPQEIGDKVKIEVFGRDG